MIIDKEGTQAQVIEFENLHEFIKTQGSHYILKYEINDDEAIYYNIIDCSYFLVLAFAFDKNFKSENIRVENDKVVPTNELTGNTITLSKVIKDTFLEDTMSTYSKEKKRRCKTGK